MLLGERVARHRSAADVADRVDRVASWPLSTPPLVSRQPREVRLEMGRVWHLPLAHGVVRLSRSHWSSVRELEPPARRGVVGCERYFCLPGRPGRPHGGGKPLTPPAPQSSHAYRAESRTRGRLCHRCPWGDGHRSRLLDGPHAAHTHPAAATL